MARAILTACSPWLVLLLVLILAAWALVRFSRAQLRLGRLLELHRDEVGSVQSLSFVLTLPLFIMIMMMIVQVSQLMIGTVVVHYAAFAAARSAAVWIPAAMAEPEGPCCISSYCRRSRRPGPGRAGTRPHGRRLRPRQRRADLHDRARQPEVRQDRLGGDPGLRADLAVARPGLAGPHGGADGCGLEERLRHAVAQFELQQRHRSAAGSQAGLRHAEHRRRRSAFSTRIKSRRWRL